LKIMTRKFGEIEIDKKKILVMPEGLPGFPGFERFILLEDPKSAPFCWFQSIEEANLALVVMNPLSFKPDYQLDLQTLIAGRDWKNVKQEELLIFVVINIKEGDPKNKITANLMGPLICNLENNEVVQIALCDSDYSHQYDVLEAISNKET